MIQLKEKRKTVCICRLFSDSFYHDNTNEHQQDTDNGRAMQPQTKERLICQCSEDYAKSTKAGVGDTKLHALQRQTEKVKPI